MNIINKVFFAGCLLAMTSAAAVAQNAWVTADNYYDLYINGNASLSNRLAPGGDQLENWSTPESADINWNMNGLNTILIVAENAGAESLGNPAALIAKFNIGDRTVVTDSSWLCSTEQDSAGNRIWKNAVEIGPLGTSPWNSAGNLGTLSSTVNGSELTKWIWSSGINATQASPVWFMTTVSTVSAVPEPGTILAALSILAPAGIMFRRRK